MIDAHRVTLSAQDDFDGWRDAARDLAEAGVPASAVVWQVEGGEADLFGSESVQPAAPSFPVPRAFVDLAKSVVCHSDPERFGLLYALLLELKANRHALDDEADPLVRRLNDLGKAVRRDVHKMHAFVRFREIDGRFVAFFEPEHHIVRRAAIFFVNRFTNMRWSILTPELSIHWDGQALTEGPGATRADAPSGDPLEETWRTYYASIFNPARLKVGAMLKEMPKKYWRNMPETSLVEPLIAGARNRELEMIQRSADATIVKEGLKHAVDAERVLEPGGNLRASWEALLKDARNCTRCDLYKHATQTVFGEGPLDASIMFVGEQPGDQEDVAGRPFVGPAGQLFDAALEKAGIDRTTVYVTNAVKHFKFVPRGKKRIHSKPGAGEIEACRWWIEHERELLRPPVTVALGATAANSLFGKVMAIGRNRGVQLELPDGSECWITVHPSFLLRIPEEDRKLEEKKLFLRDLKRIKARAEELAG
ncbi:MAG: UdgX family uracil-DNA binding protein [Sphingomonas sp.]|nr:UdgX family uracil-DNA binding protein [Sphingomonas sp.]